VRTGGGSIRKLIIAKDRIDSINRTTGRGNDEKKGEKRLSKKVKVVPAPSFLITRGQNSSCRSIGVGGDRGKRTGLERVTV